ncbi:MAG: YSC84-related protein [Rhodomicrobium sp.]
MRFSKSRASGFAGMALLAMALSIGAAKAGPSEIDAGVLSTLNRFYHEVGSSRQLVKKAAGILVFPSVVKAGIGIGGEYGEGALLVHRRPQRYYNMVSGSVGLQFGAQSRSVVILFMTREALEAFNRVDGWKAGVDGSVAVVSVGAGGAADTNTVRSPAIGFILGQKGLMYNLTLEGSKISRIYR